MELSAYRVEAVLDQKSSRFGPLLLVVLYQMDKLMNKPERYAPQKYDSTACWLQWQ